MESYQVAGQLSIFDYPEFLPEKPDKKGTFLKLETRLEKSFSENVRLRL